MKLPHLLVTAVVLHASLAHAGASDDRNRSTARSLAQDGVTALNHGDAAAASDKLERAYQLMPLPTVGVWAARALVKNGRLVSAAERYYEVSRWKGAGADALQQKAQTDAEKERAELLPRIPELTIVVEGAKPSESVDVTLDDDPVPAALVGVAQQVDPKHHVARAKFAAGTAERQIDLSEGQHETIRLSLAKAAEPVAPGVPANVSQAPEQETRAGNTWQRPTAFAVGGAGIVALGISGVFTLKALSKKSDSEAFCDGSSCRDPKGVALLDDARSAGNVATVAGIAGIALASAGVVLYFTAPHGEVTALRVSPLAVAKGGGLAAGASF